MPLVKNKIALAAILNVILIIVQLFFSSAAYADNTCWTSGQGMFSFGNVTAGSSSITSMDVTTTCQGSYGKDLWFRVCLQPDSSILSMKTNTSPAYSLNFQIYSAADTINALDIDNPAVLTMRTIGNQSMSGIFKLVGRIVSGRYDVPAMDYFNYYFPLNIRWVSAEREDLLPSCSSGTTASPYPASAMATVKNTCSISGVSPMNFGTLVGGQTPQLRGKAQSSVIIQCPVGTAYSIGLDNGQHYNGSQRQLCSGTGECVKYGLWKNNSATEEWGNVPGVSTLDISSSSGDKNRYVVYGVLPSQQWPSPGIYSDTIIVTLMY
ncbi:spore coat U domain-containing protein [Escherichia coli]|nr:spore coat U domain-containing protein [Escherichia coli]